MALEMKGRYYCTYIFAFTFVEYKVTTQMYSSKSINSPNKNESTTSINTEILVLHTSFLLAVLN